MAELLAAPWFCAARHKSLVKSLVQREVVGRYRGSMLGFLWSFLNPLFMLALYTFFFQHIMKAKWGAGDESTAGFATMLFAGLVVHGLAAEVLARSTGLITNNVNYVKKVVFPLEILPWTTLISAVFHGVISLLVLVGFSLFSGNDLHWTIILVPLVLLPFCVFLLGCAWFICSLGVYFRDIEQMMGSLLTLLLFTSSAFFSVENAPEILRPFLMLNPLTIIIDAVRDVVIIGRAPNWFLLGCYSSVSLVIFYLGFFWFEKTKKGFADVL